MRPPSPFIQVFGIRLEELGWLLNPDNLFSVPTNYVTAFDTPSPTQGAQRRQDDVSYAPDEPASTVPDTTEPASPPYVPEPVSTVPEVTGDS